MAEKDKKKRLFSLFLEAQRILHTEEHQRGLDILQRLKQEELKSAEFELLMVGGTVNAASLMPHDLDIDLVAQAAREGHPQAMGIIGMQTLTTAEGEKDEGKAWALIHEAAKAGDAMAQAWANPESHPKNEMSLFANGIFEQFARRDMAAAKACFSGCKTEPARVHMEMLRKICQNCHRLDHDTKFKMCDRCRGPRYCSPDCQKKDWPKHRLVCKSRKE